MSLAGSRRPLARVTLVPLIDVLFILLVYFMVTSVYLDLDMIPAAATDDSLPGDAVDGVPGQGGRLLLQIRADGRVALRGQTLAAEDLPALLTAEGDTAGLSVMVLPSGNAPVQALASVLDALSSAGVAETRIVRLERRP